MITEIFRASVRSYKDLPLNLYHIQWKFRDEVRPRFGVMRCARVPDEGRLFLRSRRRGRAPFLQQDVRRLPAHLRAARPDRDPDGRRHRPDRRRPQPRIHHPRLDRRERGVLPQGLSAVRAAARGHRLRQRRGDAGRGRQMDFALRRDLGKARRRRLRARSTRPRAFPPAASRSAIFSISGPSIRRR